MSEGVEMVDTCGQKVARGCTLDVSYCTMVKGRTNGSHGLHKDKSVENVELMRNCKKMHRLYN